MNLYFMDTVVNKKIISSLNTMKDANGNVYNFEGKTIEELGMRARRTIRIGLPFV